MSFSYDTTFSLIEWLALMGLTQGLLILVYIVFRARSLRQAATAILYFLTLSSAFALQFALRLEDFSEPLRVAKWAAWMSGPPLCYLLVVQIAQGGALPRARHFLVLLAVPLAAALSFAAGGVFDVCEDGGRVCVRLFDWLYWTGAMAGGAVLLALWAGREVFPVLKESKSGKERYWLVLALALANVVVVATALLRSYGAIAREDADALLLVSGFGFAYLVTTALFRVYPLPVQMSDQPRGSAPALSPEDKALADKVRTLMTQDKLYQEPTLSRADLARALNTSEGAVSRVINSSFGKSFPQMLNAFRVEDAKVLLRNPEIPIQVVASESGFNSLSSFNRVFRDITGETPSSFRAKQVGNG